MNSDIANWSRYWTGCQTAKVSRHNRPVFGKFEKPTERFDHVHVDLVGPLPYSHGFKYLLRCVDRFTHWPEAIRIIDIRAETGHIYRWMGVHFGIPATITTDRGAQFESMDVCVVWPFLWFWDIFWYTKYKFRMMAYVFPIHHRNTHTIYNQNTLYLIGRCNVAMVTNRHFEYAN